MQSFTRSSLIVGSYQISFILTVTKMWQAVKCFKVRQTKAMWHDYKYKCSTDTYLYILELL